MQLKLNKSLRKDLKKFKVDNQKAFWQILLTPLIKKLPYSVVLSNHLRECLKLTKDDNSFYLYNIENK